MRSRRLTRRLSAAAGVAAIIGMGGLAACGTSEQAPETTTPTTTTTVTTTPSTAPPLEPTEKNITPGGGNKFTPTHVQTPAPPTGRRGYSPNGGG